MKVVVICSESFSAKTALANLAISSLLVIPEKKVFLVGGDGVLEIIRNSLLEFLKDPILLSFEEEKEERKILSDEYLKFVSFVGQHKIVHIRSPCNAGIFNK